MPRIKNEDIEASAGGLQVSEGLFFDFVYDDKLALAYMLNDLFHTIC
jgi:hypothetical protein